MGQNHALLEDQPSLSPDLLPTKSEARTWKAGHFFSIWMGSVHNVPSYVTIGGFFALGMSVWQVFFIIMLSSLLLAVMMVLNGHAGSKYGIPFSILLRSSYGMKGALFPGVLRGVIAAIMWFGLQTYAGSLAVTILIGEFWPAYLTLGGGFNFLGLNLPELLSFLLFWMINVLFIFAGMERLGKLTKFVSPLVFVVFGGMAIWSINLAGGIAPILSYSAKGVEGNSFFIFMSCVSAIMATWVAQILSVADITRFSRSNKDQSIGQISGLIITYLLFAVASITIIVGSEIAFGVPIWNVLDVVERFDSKFAIILSLMTICISTLSVNIIGNIIPAGFQLTALFPKRLNFKTGALIATIIGILIMPWKLMENPTSILAFLNIVGGLLSPVIGVMLTHYFLICKKKINLQELYSINHNRFSYGINLPAMLATIIAGIISLLGNFVPAFGLLTSISWFTGISLAVLLYLLFLYTSQLLAIKFEDIKQSESR
ncbi:NCS1 family nucleobase:cation symporter [Bacillus sp. sid0103]|uniref:NCS1 family nucleobase:cation symporter n=1 Tax=Bacillus sp. sid0103 TaxID=2856337 RepID=UPI001C450199|nr:NCS1 family nucleobase:cation symporter [Bacillus sp. sid0103]MBV7505520.1 NCS1 family nucleobase:cation symporter [Bacillus sp. sid0103]